MLVSGDGDSKAIEAAIVDAARRIQEQDGSEETEVEGELGSGDVSGVNVGSGDDGGNDGNSFPNNDGGEGSGGLQ